MSNPTETHSVRVSFSAVQAALLSMGPCWGADGGRVCQAVAEIIPLEVRAGAAPGSIKVFPELLARLRYLAQALPDAGTEAELRCILKAVLDAAPAQWVRQVGLPEGVGSYSAG